MNRVEADQLFILEIMLYFTFVEHAFKGPITANSISSLLHSAIFYLAENATAIPDVEEVSGPKGTELLKTPIELKNGEWDLKVVPWIGGRIISMTHIPSGTLIMIFNIFILLF